MIDWSKHYLSVLLHDELSLEFFLSGHIREHENNLALGPEIVSFDSKVVVDPIEVIFIASTWDLLLDQRLFLLCLIVLAVIAWWDKSLMHVEQYCFVSRYLNHFE